MLSEEDQQVADLYIIYSAMVEWSSIFFLKTVSSIIFIR